MQNQYQEFYNDNNDNSLYFSEDSSSLEHIISDEYIQPYVSTIEPTIDFNNNNNNIKNNLTPKKTPNSLLSLKTMNNNFLLPHFQISQNSNESYQQDLNSQIVPNFLNNNNNNNNTDKQPQQTQQQQPQQTQQIPTQQIHYSQPQQHQQTSIQQQNNHYQEIIQPNQINNTYINNSNYSHQMDNPDYQDPERVQLTMNSFKLIQYCNQLSAITKQAYSNPYFAADELENLTTMGSFIQFEIISLKSSLSKKKPYQPPQQPLQQQQQQQIQQINNNNNSKNISRPYDSTTSIVPISTYGSPLVPQQHQQQYCNGDSTNSSVFSSAISSPIPQSTYASPYIKNQSPIAKSTTTKVTKKQLKGFKQSPTYINLTENMIRAQTKKQKKPVNRVCVNCKTSDTPEWRRGPLGAKTLCNACGIRYRLQQQQNPTSTINSPRDNNFSMIPTPTTTTTTTEILKQTTLPVIQSNQPHQQLQQQVQQIQQIFDDNCFLEGEKEFSMIMETIE